MGLNKSTAFPSNYLSKDDLDSPIIATIAFVRFEEIKNQGGSEEKAVVTFHEQAIKKLVLGALVNWNIIEAAYGPDTDNWCGKKIEIYHDPNIMFGAKQTGGTRVRIPAAVQTKPADAFLSLPQAIEYAAKNGVGEQDLKDALKARGLIGYSPSRDTKTVQEIVALKQPLGQQPAASDDTIPF